MLYRRDSSGALGVAAYIDDILIYAPSEETHDDILWKVLCHLHMSDFQIQLQKCILHQPQLPFVSRIMLAEGISLTWRMSSDQGGASSDLPDGA